MVPRFGTRSSLALVVLIGCAGATPRPVLPAPSDPCPALEVEASSTLAPAASMSSPVIPADLSQGCVAADGGTWWIRPLRVDIVSRDEETIALCPFSAVFVDADGHRIESDSSVFADASLDEPCATEGDAYSGVFVSIVDTHDFDHDGRAELILEIGRWVHEEYPARSVVVLSVRGGEVVRYPPTEGIAVTEIADVDGDSSPDLVSFEPFVAWCEGPLSDEPCGGPRVVHHALRDGTFTDRDAVAVAALEQACPTAPVVVDLENLDASIRALHCARLRGRSTEELLVLVEEAVAATSGATNVGIERARRTLTAAATIEPHLRLR